jgi:hypothetical protein
MSLGLASWTVFCVALGFLGSSDRFTGKVDGAKLCSSFGFACLLWSVVIGLWLILGMFG